MGHAGLALSFALTTTGEMTILLLVLRRTNWRLEGARPGAPWVAPQWRTALFVPVAYWMGQHACESDGSALWARCARAYALFAFGLGTAFLVYVAVAYLIGARELHAFARRVAASRAAH